jgi:hypothetical protein
MRSSDGYSVRLVGRTDLQYEDAHGELHIHAEAMSKPWSNIVVETKSIPDRPAVTREEVIARLHRAFAFAGWTLIEAPGRVED